MGRSPIRQLIVLSRTCVRKSEGLLREIWNIGPNERLGRTYNHQDILVDACFCCFFIFFFSYPLTAVAYHGMHIIIICILTTRSSYSMHTSQRVCILVCIPQSTREQSTTLLVLRLASSYHFSQLQQYQSTTSQQQYAYCSSWYAYYAYYVVISTSSQC